MQGSVCNGQCVACNVRWAVCSVSSVQSSVCSVLCAVWSVQCSVVQCSAMHITLYGWSYNIWLVTGQLWNTAAKSRHPDCLNVADTHVRLCFANFAHNFDILRRRNLKFMCFYNLDFSLNCCTHINPLLALFYAFPRTKLWNLKSWPCKKNIICKVCLHLFSAASRVPSTSSPPLLHLPPNSSLPYLHLFRPP